MCSSKSAERRRRYNAKATKAWHARLPANVSSRTTDRLQQSESRTSTQLNSHFIGKLPIELRRMIFRELLGGEYVLVQIPDENKIYRQSEIGKEEIPFKMVSPKAKSLLSLAGSCKTAYVISSSKT